jgi:hypothetical protein
LQSHENVPSWDNRKRNQDTAYSWKSNVSIFVLEFLGIEFDPAILFFLFDPRKHIFFDVYFILFYFILFYFILFYFILFSSVLVTVSSLVR